jgi:hypothetical protein
MSHNFPQITTVTTQTKEKANFAYITVFRVAAEDYVRSSKQGASYIVLGR